MSEIRSKNKQISPEMQGQNWCGGVLKNISKKNIDFHFEEAGTVLTKKNIQ